MMENANTNTNVIEVRDLVKVYKDGTEALKGVTFDVRRGEFFGFLGPNGAGKSTTIKILTTLLARTSGDAWVLGFDVAAAPNEVRARIGYAAQEVGIDDELTGRENLTLQGRLYHLDEKTLRRRIDELLAMTDLEEDADRPAGSYSGGMRKRLDLATGLVHHPQILFLDEPTTGLDPQTRANLWIYLERLNKQEELTIFLTTHYMEEADRLCQRLAIIDHGDIVAMASPDALKRQIGGELITLSFKDHSTPQQELCARAHSILTGLDRVTGADCFDEGINVYVGDGPSAVPDVILALQQNGLSIDRLSLVRPSLDDVFLKYTGRKIRDEGPVQHWRGLSMGRMFGGGRRRPG
jgi:ABC-2 type transport system ATP-binding protein